MIHVIRRSSLLFLPEEECVHELDYALSSELGDNAFVDYLVKYQVLKQCNIDSRRG